MTIVPPMKCKKHQIPECPECKKVAPKKDKPHGTVSEHFMRHYYGAAKPAPVSAPPEAAPLPLLTPPEGAMTDCRAVHESFLSWVERSTTVIDFRRGGNVNGRDTYVDQELQSLWSLWQDVAEGTVRTDSTGKLATES